MTNLIAPFNTLADGWSTLALTMFVQSSLVILVLLLLDWTLRRRVPAALRYGLLLLVLAKLVLPPGWASPSALAYWLRPASELRANPAGGVARVTVREVEATMAQHDQADSPGVASSPRLTWPALFTGLWGMGALTLLGVLLAPFDQGSPDRGRERRSSGWFTAVAPWVRRVGRTGRKRPDPGLGSPFEPGPLWSAAPYHSDPFGAGGSALGSGVARHPDPRADPCGPWGPLGQPPADSPADRLLVASVGMGREHAAAPGAGRGCR